ncbi:MAG TPA: IS1634 family transposase [Clostridium sp.]|nr:IS1634 family transposase [Clostridium sp.]
MCDIISLCGGDIMFLKSITKNNVTRLYFYESYYKDKKSKQRMVESLGRLDELKKLYNDPIAHFDKLAKEETLRKKESESTSIDIPLYETLKDNEDNLKNVGYVVLKILYRELELDKFCKIKTQNREIRYNFELIFRLLVFSRVLFPGSKRKTYAQKDIYFESFSGFSLDDVYSALDIIYEHQEELQKWIYERSQKICERDLSVTYFDCTNYYFDIGRPDIDVLDDEGNPVNNKGKRVDAKYRKRGPEKNHRPDPIVQMGLLMDKNGIPIAYDLFPGNESEKVHMRPVIDRIKTEFSDSRIIFVADRGLNTSDNIYFLNGDNKGEKNLRDGYVYGQSIRGADAEFKEWVLKDNYKVTNLKNDLGEEFSFIHKSRIYPKIINVNLTVPGRKKKKKKAVSIDQKQMVYYSEKYARKQRRDRNVMIERAKDMIKHPKKYDKVTSAGSAAYVNNISFDKTTGEIVDGVLLTLNIDKINEEAKYDGYYSIVTSELKMSDIEMQEIYRGLARIEETFKISKSDFEARPVHVRTNEHIDAHFATCFASLVFIRLLQAKLGGKYPVEKIINSLRKYNCTNLYANIWQFVYFDEILKDCEKAFDIELKRKYRNQLEMRRLLRY